MDMYMENRHTSSRISCLEFEKTMESRSRGLVGYIQAMRCGLANRELKRGWISRR
jgi:hypothetical protein